MTFGVDRSNCTFVKFNSASRKKFSAGTTVRSGDGTRSGRSGMFPRGSRLLLHRDDLPWKTIDVYCLPWKAYAPTGRMPMLSRENNELICRVGAGTPKGKKFRGFWIPALLSEGVPAPGCDPSRV